MKRLKRCTTSSLPETNLERESLTRCSSSSLPESLLESEDILTEILSRVPARALLRFKRVSKRWLSLISDPKFCHLHTIRNPKPSTSAVLSAQSSKFPFIPLHSGSGSPWPSQNPLKHIPNLPCHDKFKITQSCNGLFLCHPEVVLPPVIPDSYWLSHASRPTYHFLLNPTTKHFTKLIPPAAAAASTTQPRIFGHALFFDPSKSPHYKVAFFWSPVDLSPGHYCLYHYTEIYSSETKTWSLLSTFFETQPVLYLDGVYCNGAVHWVGICSEMAYYNIEQEHIGFVEGFPDSQEKNWETRYYRHFGESSDGHLRLIDIYSPCFTKFQVLEMGTHYSGWFVKYNVDLDPLCAVYPRIHDFRILFFAKGENEDESSSLLLHSPGKLFSYNLNSNTFKSIDLTPQAGADDSLPRIDRLTHLYMETLACV